VEKWKNRGSTCGKVVENLWKTPGFTGVITTTIAESRKNIYL